MKASRLVVLLCTLSVLAPHLLRAQEPQAAQPAVQTAGEPAAAPAVESVEDQAPFEYQIGPGDVLSIQVFGVKEFDLSSRVSNSGRVHIPYVGIMLVGGMTTIQLEREIAKSIERHELVSEPQVRVQVDKHEARPVYVIGDVTNPGQFVITSETYVLDLISKAGGFLPSADEKGFLYRRTPAQPSIETRLVGDGTPNPLTTPPALVSVPVSSRASQESADGVTSLDFEALRAGTKSELNVRVQGGDVIVVPRRQQRMFWVIGDVITPGPYAMPRRGQLMASQALIYAGGPLATAKNGSAFIMRHDAAGAHEAVEFDFGKIIKGEQPDIPVQQNDILFVPRSNVKYVGLSLVNLVPRLLQQYLIF